MPAEVGRVESKVAVGESELKMSGTWILRRAEVDLLPQLLYEARP